MRRSAIAIPSKEFYELRRNKDKVWCLSCVEAENDISVGIILTFKTREVALVGARAYCRSRYLITKTPSRLRVYTTAGRLSSARANENHYNKNTISEEK